MSDNTKQMKSRRKMGKTLLVSSQRNTDTIVDKAHLTEDKLDGLLKTTEKDGKFFLLFENHLKAKDALFYLRKEHNYFVKFSHYKIFFKCVQLESETPSEDFEHKVFKDAMRALVQSKTNGHVIYAPRLYRSSDKSKYIGCGNITVDTKECEDALLSNDGELKNSKIGESGKFKVTFRRFRQQFHTDESNHENL